MIDYPDREMLRKATAQLTAANAVIKFVSDQLRDKYQLPDGASITPDGAIIYPTREVADADRQPNLFHLQSEVAVSREATGGNECLSEGENLAG